MSQQNDSGLVSITAAAARAAYLRVYNNSGTWATAGAANQADGVQQQPSLAATDIVSIKISNAPGTRKMVADGVIAVGAVVYAGATGYVSAAGTILEGRALEAGAAAGDVIEVLPLHNVDVPSSAGVATPTVTFNGATGANEIRLTANLADALSIEDTAADIIVVTTTTGTPAVAITPATSVTGKLTLGNEFIPKAIITPVAAAGSTVADAAALGAATVTHITSDGAAKGVKLPAMVTADIGTVKWIINDSATAAEVYAESTGTVNGLAADASVVIPASKGLLCFCTAAKTWIAFDMTAAATAS